MQLDNNQDAKHVQVILNHGELGTVAEWCNSHCHGKWNMDISTQYMYDNTDPTLKIGQTAYEFNFTDDSDYITFLLWKK